MSCSYINGSSSSESEDDAFDLDTNNLRPYAFEPLHSGPEVLKTSKSDIF